MTGGRTASAGGGEEGRARRGPTREPRLGAAGSSSKDDRRVSPVQEETAVNSQAGLHLA